MSADNGIYILKTKDNQYRVIHTRAIENLYRNYDELIPNRIVEYYGKSKYTYNKNIARDIAFNIARDIECNGYLEYGVREIIIDKTWNEILQEVKELTSR